MAKMRKKEDKKYIIDKKPLVPLRETPRSPVGKEAFVGEEEGASRWGANTHFKIYFGKDYYLIPYSWNSMIKFIQIALPNAGVLVSVTVCRAVSLISCCSRILHLSSDRKERCRSSRECSLRFH